MNEIKEKKVTLRSKYVYLAEKLSRFGGLLIFSILAVLFSLLLFWYFKSTDNLVYLRFGRPGIFPFLQTFPYFFALVLSSLFVVTGILIKRIYYKKSLCLLLGLFAVLVFISGGVMVACGMHQKMEKFAFDRREEILVGSFLHHGRNQNDRGIAGIVIEKSKDTFKVGNMCGEQMVKWLDSEHRGEKDFSIGDFIVGIGEWRGADFFAMEVKVVEKDNLKMVVGDGRVNLPPPPEFRPGQNNEWRPKACQK